MMIWVIVVIVVVVAIVLYARRVVSDAFSE